MPEQLGQWCPRGPKSAIVGLFIPLWAKLGWLVRDENLNKWGGCRCPWNENLTHVTHEIRPDLALGLLAAGEGEKRFVGEGGGGGAGASSPPKEGGGPGKGLEGQDRS